MYIESSFWFNICCFYFRTFWLFVCYFCLMDRFDRKIFQIFVADPGFYRGEFINGGGGEGVRQSLKVLKLEVKVILACCGAVRAIFLLKSGLTWLASESSEEKWRNFSVLGRRQEQNKNNLNSIILVNSYDVLFNKIHCYFGNQTLCVFCSPQWLGCLEHVVVV